MILTSATFAQLLDIAPSCLHLMLADGSEVPREAIRSAKWSGGCNAGEDITLGSTVATHLEAEIDRTRLGGLDLTDAKLASTLTLDGAEDDVPCGVLQVGKVDGDDDILTITANDAMVYAFDQRYALDDEALGFDWEVGVDGLTLLNAICDELGITLATTDLPPILLQYQDCSGLTYREVLAFLACMWGKFARMDGTGQLVLGWYAAADRSIGPNRYYDGELKKANADYTVEYLKCYSDHLAETLLCGDLQGARGISISCPWMTQEQLQVVWESIARFTYRPVSSLRFLGDPRLEPGDIIQVTDRAGETYSVPVMSITHEFDGGLISEIAAAGKSAASSSGAAGDDHVGPVTRMIQRAKKDIEASIIKYEDRINAKVEATDGRLAQLQIEVDGITLEVTSVSTSGGKTYARIRLKGGNGEWQEGQILLDGNVNVSGQLSAEALYAVLGDVANLMVNRLSTSRRIPKYLARDTTDDRYFYVANEEQRMVRAWTDGSTEQARTPDGALLYWEQDISAATLGGNGYPFIDGVQVPTTTTESPYPVMVYVYKEGDRWRQTFAKDGNYGPQQIWGEGDGTSSGRGRGYHEKLGLSYDIYNLGTDGVKRGVFMGNDYTDITGLRQTAKLDLSRYEEGVIVEIIDGGIVNQLNITFNEEGDPALVTNSAGHRMEMKW